MGSKMIDSCVGINNTDPNTITYTITDQVPYLSWNIHNAFLEVTLTLKHTLIKGLKLISPKSKSNEIMHSKATPIGIARGNYRTTA
jgi:hypothetical protein